MEHSILVALDGSAFAEQAIAHAQAITDGSSTELILVAVAPAVDDISLAEVGVIPYWMEADYDAARQHLDHYLKHMADRLAAGGQQVRTRLVTGHPAEAILQVADAEHADLIVMTTHGRSGLSRLWLGSVAAKVAQGAQMPVLLIRQQVAMPDTQEV